MSVFGSITSPRWSLITPRLKEAGGMSLNISASTGATSARRPPASAAPIASTRRAARSPEAAATRRKLISRAGSSCTRPFISASRSSVAFCAS